MTQHETTNQNIWTAIQDGSDTAANYNLEVIPSEIEGAPTYKVTCLAEDIGLSSNAKPPVAITLFSIAALSSMF